MPVKKRPRLNDQNDFFSRSKKTRNYSNSNDGFESQDIWKNLERIRKTNLRTIIEIPNSFIYITFLSSIPIKDIENCIKALHEFIEIDKLHLLKLKRNSSNIFIVLKNFSILDCCLTLAVLFAFKSRYFTTSSNRDYFTIPNGTNMNGTFYLPKSSINLSEKNQNIENRTSNLNINEIMSSRYETLLNFTEYFVSNLGDVNLTSFMGKIAMFISNIKFGKKKNTTIEFTDSLFSFVTKFNIGINELALKQEQLFDIDAVSKINKPLIDKSKSTMLAYIKALLKYNNTVEQVPKIKTLKESHSAKTPISQGEHSQQTSSRFRNTTKITENGNSNLTYTQNTHTSTVDNVGHFNNFMNKPNFMTQEQIKEHSIATIKSSIESVKSKSPYQILKVYVKCPRQNYIDLVYQNLNVLRTTTNCNILVLNLSNLHESQPWFNSLNISKHTSVVQVPHPSTVRIVSVGGVGEHILHALEMISNIVEDKI